MQATRRGEPLPINRALNASKAKLGLELPVWAVIVFVAVAAFLLGYRMLAVLSVPALAGGTCLFIRKHPKMFQLWGLGLYQRSYYDPRKQ